jgi:hypothetical protein
MMPLFRQISIDLRGEPNLGWRNACAPSPTRRWTGSSRLRPRFLSEGLRAVVPAARKSSMMRRWVAC